MDSIYESFTILSAVREPDAERAPGRIVDLRYEYVNREGCRLIRRSPEQIVGKTLLELMPQHLENGLFDKYVQLIETGQPLEERAFTYEEELGWRSRISGAFDIRAARFGDGLILTVSDVTEHAQLEDENRKAQIRNEIHRRLFEQRELERQSYASEIHDGPVQTLSSLIFHRQYLKQEYSEPYLQNAFEQIGGSVRSAVNELRTMINELRPPAVIRFGLARAIEDHVENLHYRHSNASRAWVDYHREGDWLKLEIHDNGRGFDASHDITALTEDLHFGLAGISERVEALNGELDIISQPGQGTRLTVRVPMQAVKSAGPVKAR